MGRICKLVLYYFLYQFLFTALIALPSTWIQIINNGGDVSSFVPDFVQEALKEKFKQL